LFSLENVLHHCVVHSIGLGSHKFQQMVEMSLRARGSDMLRCHTLPGEMGNMTTIVAGLGTPYCIMLWQTGMWHNWWRCQGSQCCMIMLWSTGSPMLMLLLRWLVMWGVHHPVFGRSSTRWGYQSLLLLTFLVSMDGVIHDDGIAQKLWKGANSVER
jgi:hypothetical protein